MSAESSSPKEPAPKKAAAQILKAEVREGLDALERTSGALFLSALSGGLDLGFSLLLMGVMESRFSDRLPAGLVDLLVANMYSVGFIFVIVGRSELFTEQTSLAVLPVLRGRATVGSLLRLWVTVYAGNLLGAIAFAGLISWAGPTLGIIDRASFGRIASRLLQHSAGPMFVSALLAGWLMGLLSWMVSAARETVSQILIVWLITTAIGLAELGHVVMGAVEVFAGAFVRQGIGPDDLLRFLFWTTIGNAVGGSIFVALIKYGHARPVE